MTICNITTIECAVQCASRLPLQPLVFALYQCILQSILSATQRSFAAMKRRLGSKHTTGIFYLERPFFNVDVELKVNINCCMVDCLQASRISVKQCDAVWNHKC
jgi:hypothetical protein